MKEAMDEEEYQKRIPPWCYYQTIQQHMDNLMLCWSLAKKPMIEKECRGCDMYEPNWKHSKKGG